LPVARGRDPLPGELSPVRCRPLHCEPVHCDASRRDARKPRVRDGARARAAQLVHKYLGMSPHRYLMMLRLRSIDRVACGAGRYDHNDLCSTACGTSVDFPASPSAIWRIAVAMLHSARGDTCASNGLRG
jgi:hypothetical protein